MLVLGIRSDGTYVLGYVYECSFTTGKYIAVNKGMDHYSYAEFEKIIENPGPKDIPVGY